MKAKNFLSRLKRLRIPGYLREVSVVIIGVAITLYAGGLVNGRKEKKDLELQLQAIYAELEENLIRIDDIAEYHHEHELLRDYLFTVVDDPGKYNNDSIMKYDKMLSSIPDFSYKKGAFDMFIYTGAMRWLSDRKLLLEITDCYAGLEGFKQANDEHFALKSQIFSDVYKLDRKLIFDKNYDLRSPQWNSKFNFHLLNSGLEESAKKLREELEKVLANRKSR